MGRSPCCDKVGLRKGTWTPEEDQKLLSYIQQHGHGSWRALPAKAGLQRCGKSCRLRWTNYLRPDIKRGKFSLQEEQTIIQLHALLGNRWSAIATHLPKRTDNEIKNYWNTHLKKRLTKMGIDPSTHKPKTNPLGSGQKNDTAYLSHLAQWENARLEAESRLVRESKLIMSTISPHHNLCTTTLSVHSLNKTFRVPPPLEPMVPACLDVLKAWQGTWKSVNGNGFFNPTGTLQSPTSILHFSDNIFANSSTSCFGDNLSFSAISYVQNPKPLGGGITKENNGPTNKARHPNDDMLVCNDPIDAAYFEDSLKPPSFMEGFADADGGQNSNNIPMVSFYDNLDGRSNGDLEDNKKYWNNNLLNAENPTSESNYLLSDL